MVGKSERELEKEGVKFKVGRFPLKANSRARTNGETWGMVKIVAEKRNNKILGGCVIGENAGEIIHELVVAMKY
jgi:dihydrolipoamide dehydrogenase